MLSPRHSRWLRLLLAGAELRLYRAGVVLPGQAVVPYGTLKRTEFFNEFGRQFGLHRGLGAVVVSHERQVGMVNLFRGECQDPFDDAEVIFVRMLVPHLQRAMAMHHRISQLEYRQTALVEMLDSVSFGAILLNGDGEVVHVNAAARTIIQTSDGIAVRRKRLALSSRLDDNWLNGQIGGAARRAITTNGAQAQAFHLLPRPSGRRPFLLFVTPLNPAEQLFDEFALCGDAPVAVFVHDPEQHVVGLEQRLRVLYGLTKAEATVASALLEGHSVERVADLLCISRHTARTHLRRIFEKTQTRRQAEFVRLALAAGLITHRP